MRTTSLVSAILWLAALPYVVSSQDAPAARAEGYLTGSAIPDLIRVLPSAPAPDSARDAADRAIFKATRALQDSPRWKLAQSDDKLSVAALLADFSCALGVSPTAQNSPVLTRVLARVFTDAETASGPAKDFFHRRRPFVVDQGPTCIAVSKSFEKTWDFPSIHTTLGWAAGMILAEIDPARASLILTRARSFGESRVVCGVHNASAVEAGRVAGAALFAALFSNDAFRADLEKARSELAALQSKEMAACAAQASLIAKSPY
jgi:acid phosphatase (class A)